MEKENVKAGNESLKEKVDILRKENVALKKRIGGFVVSNAKYQKEIRQLKTALSEADGVIAGLENQSNTLAEIVAKKDELIDEWMKNFNCLQDAYMAFVDAPWYKRIFM